MIWHDFHKVRLMNTMAAGIRGSGGIAVKEESNTLVNTGVNCFFCPCYHDSVSPRNRAEAVKHLCPEPREPALPSKLSLTIQDVLEQPQSESRTRPPAASVSCYQRRLGESTETSLGVLMFRHMRLCYGAVTSTLAFSRRAVFRSTHAISIPQIFGDRDCFSSHCPISQRHEKPIQKKRSPQYQGTEAQHRE